MEGRCSGVRCYDGSTLETMAQLFLELIHELTDGGNESALDALTGVLEFSPSEHGLVENSEVGTWKLPLDFGSNELPQHPRLPIIRG